MARLPKALMVVAGLATVASAEVHLVEPGGSGHFPNIQAAITGAADGDTIGLADGTFVGAGNRGIDFEGKAVTVRSLSGDPRACVIDCESADRAFIFASGEGAGSILEGIGIQNGYGPTGGAVTCSADPTIAHCVFSDNVSWDLELGGSGGAVFLNASCATISDCEFTENEAPSGIYYSGVGGAVFCGGGTPTMRRCAFTGNVCGALGGGIYVVDSAPRIEACTFTGNDTRAIAFWASGGQVADCRISSNRGGVLCWGGSHPTFTNCIISHEESSIGAAVDCCLDATPTLVNCTLHANRAEGRGAGLYCDDACFPVLIRTIIAFSTAGSAISCDETSGALLSCCDLHGNAGGDWTACIAGQLGSNGNISRDPLFCDTSQDDLTLAANSPCSPEHAPAGCELIGAMPVGCGPAEVDPPLPATVSAGALALAIGAQPAASAVRVRLTMRRAGRVRMAVHDVCGACLRVLVDAEIPSGRLDLPWDLRDDRGRRVSPGIYFLRCTSGDAHAHGRITVIR